MRMSAVASLSFTVVLLSACGANQPEQVSSQTMNMQNETQVEIQKQDATAVTANDMSSESTPGTENGENTSIVDLKTDIAAESTSDNPMMKDSGLSQDGSQVVEEQSMEALESDKNEIAKQKELAVTADPKS